MLFNSIDFLFFFPIVTALFFIMPHSSRWLLLLIASCYFYMYFKPVYILILFLTIVVDYFAGIFIYQETDRKKKKNYLILSIFVNLGILAFFKYFNFFNSNLSLLFEHTGARNPIPYLEILLPIGLSFHTFQAMSYTIEVYRGNQHPEKHFGIYALYVMFYPQLVAGPIERPQNILHQFHEEKFFEYTRVASGLRLMLWGFFKKMVIADNLSLIVDNVFNNPGEQNGLTFFIGAIFFTFQIYADFSGYSDIAIGSARVMGFQLMRNFNLPYTAQNIKDFWSRWHISLSTWFRDYLYIPLGGNRVNPNRKRLNIFIVFVISGLWHGASWNFIVWGGLHGLFLVIYDFFYVEKQTRPENKFSLKKLFNALFTLLLVVITWIFFRVVDVNQAFKIVKTIALDLFQSINLLLHGHPVFEGLASPKFELLLLFLLIILFYAMDWLKEQHSFKKIFIKNASVRYASYLVILLMIFLFSAMDETQFIYFQF